MAQAFYKQEHKVYIFSGDEINDEDFINAIDNSPTYKRSTRDLELLKSSFRAYAEAAKAMANENSTDVVNTASDTPAEPEASPIEEENIQ